jgi:sulfate adenylyltransferase subunit 2
MNTETIDTPLTAPRITTRPEYDATSRHDLSHLAVLEAEAIFIIREVAAECERPVLLFSGGKDSIVLSHLARAAFHPGPIPFPLLHIDTGHNFPETIAFRDAWIERLAATLIVRTVEESIQRGRVREETGIGASRNALQSVTLKDAVREFGFDAALGGARRDEEKARAKERVFSVRDKYGQWEPKRQRPELWSLYNVRRDVGEHLRVFPLSNWTEMDVWQYIRAKGIDLPSLYFTHERDCVFRDGVWLACADCVGVKPGERPERQAVRFRTIGDMTCTGAVLSRASTLDEIIDEVLTSDTSERGTRADDQRSQAAMEDRKREGYF